MNTTSMKMKVDAHVTRSIMQAGTACSIRSILRPGVKRLTAAGCAVALTATLVSGPAAADGLDATGQLSQDEFGTLAENLGAATHYKSVAPVESLGILGFDIGLEASTTDVDESVFDAASGGGGVDSLDIGRLHAHKGLPFGLDVAASVGAVADTDMTVYGAELRYALIEGGVALPAVGVRATYSLAEGNDDFDLENMGLEVGISKGFLMFTPYGGAGIIRSTLTSNVDGSALNEEEVDLEKVYVGLNANLGFNLAVEADRTGDYTTYSAKIGIRF